MSKNNLQIVCTKQLPAENPPEHAHIYEVGVGPDCDLLTVSDVYAAMDGGYTFFTRSISTGKIAQVEKFDCTHCGMPTLRSTGDVVQDNNLDELPICKP